MVTAQLSDETRRILFAQVDELDAMRAAIPKMSDAELRIYYVDIEREIVRRAANTTAHVERPRDLDLAATEPMSSDPMSGAMSSTEPTPSDPISSAPSTIEPTPNDATSSTPTSIEPTSTDRTSDDPTSIAPASTDRMSDNPTSTALTSIEPTSTGGPVTIDPFAEAKERKEREIAALERDYYARMLAAANGNYSRAARLAGKDRSNFKRKLEEHGLRPPGTRMTTSRKIEDAAKHTDTIVELLANNPQGLRTYQVAKHIEQAIGNAHNLLKHLKGQNRIERHGKRYNTLWTLAGGTPERRVETIPQAAVAVVSDAMGPVDGRRLRDEMAALLRDADKSPTKAALRRAIGRLVLSGVLASGGASTNGALYRLGPNAALYMLGPKREESALN